MTYTHIKIERVPQKLDEDFTKNADIADKQKLLAESAPELLSALQAMLKCCYDMERNDETLAAVKGAMKAIYKATGDDNA